MNRKALFGVITALAVGSGTAYMINSQSDAKPTPEPTDSTQVVKPQTPVANRTNTFLVISDAHLHKGVDQKAIPNGAADTGEDLWKITLEKFKEMANGTAGYPKPDFVVLLGDLPWHANPDMDSELEVARQSTGIVLTDLREVAQAADVPLIYSPGNNDSWSGDYRAFTAPNGEVPFDQDSTGTADWPVINSGACGLKSQQACLADDSEGKLGCYSVYPMGEKGGLRIIVLNTVMFASDQNSPTAWHYYGPQGTQQQDVTAQMDWFKKQFSTGNTKDKIIIGVHIPPGLDAYSHHSMWSRNLTYDGKPVLDAFLDIVGQNENRIVGMLTSHTHMDGLRKLMHQGPNELEFSDLIVSIPGIAPGHGNNPSMKFFTYDPGTFEWQNFTTVYTDYWSNQTVPTTWGSASFSFDGVFGAGPTDGMADWVSKMDSAKLLTAVTDIYTAKGQSPAGNDIGLTLEVKPGQ